VEKVGDILQMRVNILQEALSSAWDVQAGIRASEHVAGAAGEILEERGVVSQTAASPAQVTRHTRRTQPAVAEAPATKRTLASALVLLGVEAKPAEKFGKVASKGDGKRRVCD
jgi:hypothetical protein